jgi:hypothetical protein
MVEAKSKAVDAFLNDVDEHGLHRGFVFGVESCLDGAVFQCDKACIATRIPVVGFYWSSKNPGQNSFRSIATWMW